MSPFRSKQHVLLCGARKRVFAFQMVFPVSSADASLANHSMNSVGFSAKTVAKWQMGRHIAISVGASSQSGLHQDIAGLIYTHIRRKIGSIPCSKSTCKQQQPGNGKQAPKYSRRGVRSRQWYEANYHLEL